MTAPSNRPPKAAPVTPASFTETTEVVGPMIRLGDLLKVAGAVDSGGEAKALVQGGEVLVNDEVDTRRGRKLVAGDRVSVKGRTISVDDILAKEQHAEAPRKTKATPFDRPEKVLARSARSRRARPDRERQPDSAPRGKAPARKGPPHKAAPARGPARKGPPRGKR